MVSKRIPYITAEAHLVDLSPFFGCLVCESLVNHRHDLIELLIVVGARGDLLHERA